MEKLTCASPECDRAIGPRNQTGLCEPHASERVCLGEGCTLTLSFDNVSGYCLRYHRKQAYEARAVLDAGNRRFCAAERCTNVLRSHNRTGYCRTHFNEGRKVFRSDRLDNKLRWAGCSVNGCPGRVQPNNTTGYCRTYHFTEQKYLLARRREMIKQKLFVEHVNRHVLYARDEGICHLCLTAVDCMSWHVDHVIPINLSGPHCYANTAVSHPHCNTLKNATIASALPVRLAEAFEIYAQFHSL